MASNVDLPHRESRSSPDVDRLFHGGGLRWLGESTAGLARFGLPGLALGIVIAWGASFRGEQAEAQQTPSNSPVPRPPVVRVRAGRGHEGFLNPDRGREATRPGRWP